MSWRTFFAGKEEAYAEILDFLLGKKVTLPDARKFAKLKQAESVEASRVHECLEKAQKIPKTPT